MMHKILQGDNISGSKPHGFKGVPVFFTYLWKEREARGVSTNKWTFNQGGVVSRKEYLLGTDTFAGVLEIYSDK